VRDWIGIERKETLDVRGLPVPTPFSIRGLVDTDARIAAIQRDRGQALSLPIHDWITLKTSVVGDEERGTPVHELRMTFGPINAPEPPKWRAILPTGVTIKFEIQSKNQSVGGSR
jgi:hypothetical protein